MIIKGGWLVDFGVVVKDESILNYLFVVWMD